MTYTSQYPPSQNETYVKATSFASSTYEPYFATDPALSLIGSINNNGWLSANGSVTNQRFHIDLGSAICIRRIYYENAHESGTSTIWGVKNFTFWGSNDASAFAELTYAADTGWTQLTLAASTFDQHVSSNSTDPKYDVVTNTVNYRYYAFKISNNWTDATYMGARRFELQTEDGYVPPSGAKIINFI
jgi:hypothetical protein